MPSEGRVREPVPGVPQPGLERTIQRSVIDGFALTLGLRFVQFVLTDRQQYAPLVQLGHLIGVGEQMPTGQRESMNDQAEEDVRDVVGQRVLDHTDALPVPVVDRDAAF